MSEQKNLLIAAALSLSVLVGFHYFYEKPVHKQIETSQQKVISSKEPAQVQKPKAEEVIPYKAAIEQTPRLQILGPKLKGSINLKGGVIDDLTLQDYKETTNPESPSVVLLQPKQAKDGYYVSTGWQGLEEAPGEDTQWSVEGDSKTRIPVNLTHQNPITIYWVSPLGLRFERTFTIDEKYLIRVKDKVINNAKTPTTFQAHSFVRRLDTPKTSGFYILHEGAIGVLEKLQELDYKDLEKKGKVDLTSKGGWIGFTDKYWLVSLLADAKTQVQASFSHQDLGGRAVYETRLVYPQKTLKPGESYEITHRVFSGAKVLDILEDYEKKENLDRFDLAVDFGWFYFLTKPLFYTLDWFHKLLGNFGLAILALTVLTKVAAFPLALKTFRSMARMKKFQPEMERIKARYADDRMRMNQEIMAFYQKEKINPVSGCLPMLIQAPIFFCLYKVFFVSIEMRHAPFFGWIHDLSVPDPTSLFNLFGLIPWTPPSFLAIGAWPLIMGLTMFIQQKMTPQPGVDPAQEKAMLILPVMFTYMFSSFPAGLVIYWAWSNVLTILQQYLMTTLGAREAARA